MVDKLTEVNIKLLYHQSAKSKYRKLGGAKSYEAPGYLRHNNGK